MDTGRSYRRVLLAVAVLAALWGLTVAVTGGFLVATPWGRLSSRHAIRPLALAAAAAIAYYLIFREWWSADAGKLAQTPAATPRGLAAIASVVALFIGIHFGTFAATASDQSGYVSQAALWLNGELVIPAPDWVADAPWPDAAWAATPLGYRPGPRPLTQVPTYSPGLPMLMAAFQAIGGPTAVYYVVPLLGAITVWTTFLFGRLLGGPWVGLIGALLMLASPAFLLMLVQPMTDVAVTAFWAVALYAALQPGSAAAAAAGGAAALAILTRPNLVPLAGVVALVILFRQPRRVRDLLSFALACAPSVLVIAWLNGQLYGSPLRSGYGGLGELYQLQTIWPNIRFYGRHLTGTQTPLLFLALAAPALIRWTRGPITLLLVTVIFPVAVVTLYLPWNVFEDWFFVRFVLPALPPLVAAAAAVTVVLAQRVAQPAIAAAGVAALVAVLVLRGFSYSTLPFDVARDDRRYVEVARRAQALPANAVFVTLFHSGSLRYYTGRGILRWDLMEPRYFDTAVAHVKRHGHPLYVVSDPDELAQIRARLPESAVVRALDGTTPEIVSGVAVYEIR